MLGAAIGMTIAAVLQVTVLADLARKRTLSRYEKKWARQR